jgi:hypothetical protein
MRFWISHPFGRTRVGVSFGGWGRSRQYRRSRRRTRHWRVTRTVVVVRPQRADIVIQRDRIGWPSALLILLAIGLVVTYWYLALPLLFMATVAIVWIRQARR